MTGWNDPEPARPAPRRRSLAADLLWLGPASTPAREVLCAVVHISLVLTFCLALVPERISAGWAWAIVGGTLVFFALRAWFGAARWRRLADVEESAVGAGSQADP